MCVFLLNSWVNREGKIKRFKTLKNRTNREIIKKKSYKICFSISKKKNRITNLVLRFQMGIKSYKKCVISILYSFTSHKHNNLNRCQIDSSYPGSSLRSVLPLKKYSEFSSPSNYQPLKKKSM